MLTPLLGAFAPEPAGSWPGTARWARSALILSLSASVAAGSRLGGERLELAVAVAPAAEDPVAGLLQNYGLLAKSLATTKLQLNLCCSY